MSWWKKFRNSITGEDDIKEAVAKVIKDHAEFILSLDDRQREYYSNLSGKGRITWDIVRLEKRIHDLEQKAKID
jgi:hypothetical protein